MSAAISILVTILFVIVLLYLVQKLPIDSSYTTGRRDAQGIWLLSLK